MDIDLLEGDEFDGLLVDVPNGGFYPGIYRPVQGYGERPSFGLTIRLGDLPSELHSQVPVGRRPLDDGEPVVHLRGNLAPRVVPHLGHGGIDTVRNAELKLVELLNRFEACNLSHDKLFMGRRLRLELRGMRYGSMMGSPMFKYAPADTYEYYRDKFKLTIQTVHVWLSREE